MEEHDMMPPPKIVQLENKKRSEKNTTVEFLLSFLLNPPTLMLNEYPALDFQDETDNLKTGKHERPPVRVRYCKALQFLKKRLNLVVVYSAVAIP